MHLQTNEYPDADLTDRDDPVLGVLTFVPEDGAGRLTYATTRPLTAGAKKVIEEAVKQVEGVVCIMTFGDEPMAFTVFFEIDCSAETLDPSVRRAIAAQVDHMTPEAIAVAMATTRPEFTTADAMATFAPTRIFRHGEQ